MIFVATLVIVCIADVSLVAAQQSSFCPSTLSDLNAYCDARTHMGANTRVGARSRIGGYGPRGFKGSTGQQGPPGSIGLQGPKGEVGEKGSRGERGDTGSPGPPGLEGPKGEIGDKGYQGPKGESGLRGSPGIPGLQGIKGKVGEKGSNGAPGIAGLHGLIGKTGSKGSKGSVGAMNSTAVEEIVNAIVESNRVKTIMRRIVNEGVPRSCQDVNDTVPKFKTESGGVFDIYSEEVEKKIERLCDTETDGGGWTVFQRRMDGSENFFRGWDDYVNGFGKKHKEFWLGLENLYQMTRDGNFELRVDIEDFSGNRAYANYGSFRIDSSAQNYRLHVSSFSGDAGDSLISRHNGMEFSTRDADHDTDNGRNCAQEKKGAWWYRSCYRSNLNGIYRDAVGSGDDGVVWQDWKNRREYLKSTEMKFRRK